MIFLFYENTNINKYLSYVFFVCLCVLRGATNAHVMILLSRLVSSKCITPHPVTRLLFLLIHVHYIISHITSLKSDLQFSVRHAFSILIQKPGWFRFSRVYSILRVRRGHFLLSLLSLTLNIHFGWRYFTISQLIEAELISIHQRTPCDKTITHIKCWIQKTSIIISVSFTRTKYSTANSKLEHIQCAIIHMGVCGFCYKINLRTFINGSVETYMCACTHAPV